jgi:hypothetical protein
MGNAQSEVRHDVAWLQPLRWATCAVLWTVLGALWAFPHLDLSLREVSRLGLAAAICRTVVAIASHRRSAASPVLIGVALAADAALLTGLLDITGGPFNPFIVMYAVYIWVGAVAMSPWRAAIVGVVSAMGFSWLVVDHLRAGPLEHHAERLSDASFHDVVLRRSHCGTRCALRHTRMARVGPAAGATRRSPPARGTKRADGLTDDSGGGRW